MAAMTGCISIMTGVDGTVVDSSGGVLPGVAIEIRNADTNFVREVVSDSGGRFVALTLPPGRYTVTFKLAGFATLVQDNIQMTVGQSVPLNPTMKPSAVRETVTVTSDTPTVRLDADGRRQHARRNDHRTTRRFSAASSKIC